MKQDHHPREGAGAPTPSGPRREQTCCSVCDRRREDGVRGRDASDQNHHSGKEQERRLRLDRGGSKHAVPFAIDDGKTESEGAMRVTKTTTPGRSRSADSVWTEEGANMLFRLRSTTGRRSQRARCE